MYVQSGIIIQRWARRGARPNARWGRAGGEAVVRRVSGWRSAGAFAPRRAVGGVHGESG